MKIFAFYKVSGHNTPPTKTMMNVFKKMMVLACVASVAMFSQAQAASVSLAVGNVVLRVSDNHCAAQHVVVNKHVACHNHHNRFDKHHMAHCRDRHCACRKLNHRFVDNRRHR